MKNESQEDLTLSKEEICSRYYGRIVMFMLARVGERDTAEDLAQEVFYRFLKKNPSSPAIQTNVLSYLHGIAGNIAKDFLHEKTKQPLQRGEDFEKLGAICPSHEQRSMTKFDLEKCLVRLKQSDSELLISRFWKGESHEEIAGRLKMTVAGVRKRLQRALLRLKKCLNQRGVSRFRSGRGLND